VGLSIGFLREPFGSDKDKIFVCEIYEYRKKKKKKKIKMEFGKKLEPKLRRIEENTETLGSWDLKSSKSRCKLGKSTSTICHTILKIFTSLVSC
jgi:hypothetical protein